MALICTGPIPAMKCFFQVCPLDHAAFYRRGRNHQSGSANIPHPLIDFPAPKETFRCACDN